MMNYFYKICLLVSLAAAVPAGAQAGLTLDDAIRQALENNSGLKQAELSLRRYARADGDWVNQFLTVQDPSLGISNEQLLYPSGKTSDWSWGSLRFGVTLSLAADVYAQRRLASVQYESQLQSYGSQKQALVTDVSKSFYSLLAASANIDILRRDVDVKKSRYETAQVNYKQGLVSELDLLTAEYDFRTSGPALTDAENTYREDLSAFCLLIGMDASAPPALRGEISVRTLSLPSPEELTAKYADERGDVRIQKLALEQAELASQIGVFKGTPKLALTDAVSLAPENGAFPAAGEPKLSNAFSLTLSLPISSWIPGLKDDIDRKNNDDARAAAQLACDAAVKSAAQDIWKKVNAVEQAARNVETADLNSSIAQKRYDLSEQGYKGGLVSLDALQDADSDNLKSRQDALKAKVSYLTAVYDLAAALGMDAAAVFEQWGN